MRGRVWMRRALLASALLLLLFVGKAGTGRAAMPGEGEGQPVEGQPIHLVYASFDPLLDGEPAIPPELTASGGRYRLLQLAAAPERDTLAELEALGVVFYDFLPVNTYIVRLAGISDGVLGRHPAVRWVGPLHPAYKISPTARGGRLVVSLFPDVTLAQVVTGVATAGAQIVEVNREASLLVVEAGDPLIPVLAQLEGVRWIQNAAPLQEFNDDARWVSQGGVLNTTPLYEHGLSGAGQVGAVADSGLAVYPYTAADDPLYNPVPSCYVVDDQSGAPRLPGIDHRKVLAYEIPPGAEGDRYDSSGHGTHVVSSVVGDRAPWHEASTADGQAYDARVFFQDIGTGVGFPQSPVVSVNPPSDYGVLFAQAYDPNGDGQYDPATEPRTHSNSWGSTDPIYSVESAQTDAFMWSHPDFLILFAAGNQGPAAGTIGYPATAKNVVTVGATENGMADPDSMGYFSSHGTPGGRLKPTVSAPGDRITSALQGDPCGTTEKSGTSMATPTVQGVALLMRQYLWDGYYPSGVANPDDRIQPSAALLKALLINSGRPMGGRHTDNGVGGAWPASGQGWGRVTADDALYFDGDHRSLWLHDEYALDGSAGFTAAGETRTFSVTVGDGQPFALEPLKITLDWSDYPATPLSGGLVNDLDLVVVDPAGTVHKGNDVATNDFRGSGELPLLAPDRVNPWEVVYLEEPLAGEYTITVRAATLGSLALDPERAQGFALVASGDLPGHRGRVELEYPVYDVGPAATARIRLSDLDLNADRQQPETAWVNVGTEGGERVRVRLLETEADSGVFTGGLELSRRDRVPGALRVVPGDVVTVTYEDANTGTGERETARDTAKVARLPLNFSNPPLLETVANGDGDDRYTLEWQPAEETAGLSGYVIQETTVYTAPLADDAEGDINGVWTTGQAGAEWQADVQYRQSGLQSYWSGRGDTNVSVNSALRLRTALTIPAGTTSAQLQFYSRYFNDLNDNGFVEVSADGGDSWHPLRRLYADPRVVPADGRLQYHQLDLSEWIGRQLLLRFRYDNGVVSFAPDSPGWWLDEITVNAGEWQTIGMTGPDTHSFVVGGRIPGRYYYRVRALYADGSASAWSNVQAVTVTEQAAPVRAGGGGWLAGDGGTKLNFNFRVEETDAGATGQIKFRDQAAGVRVLVEEVASLGAASGECGPVRGGGALAIRGSGTLNESAAIFIVCIKDGGEPGAGQDLFFLACQSGCSYRTDGRAATATLGGGNIQIRGAGRAQESGEAAVVTLDPLLADGMVAGTVLSLSATVYDQSLVPMAGVPVTITQVAADGTMVMLEAVTNVAGVAAVPVAVSGEAMTYMATAAGTESNGMVLAPAQIGTLALRGR